MTKAAELPARVSVVDVASGRRSPWKELSPPDPAGILAIGPILMTPDGRSYVYSYRRILDDLPARFDVAPDGRFLLIKKSEEETSSRQINVILGFNEPLKRRFAAPQ